MHKKQYLSVHWRNISTASLMIAHTASKKAKKLLSIVFINSCSKLASFLLFNYCVLCITSCKIGIYPIYRLLRPKWIVSFLSSCGIGILSMQSLWHWLCTIEFPAIATQIILSIPQFVSIPLILSNYEPKITCSKWSSNYVVLSKASLERW